LISRQLFNVAGYKAFFLRNLLKTPSLVKPKNHLVWKDQTFGAVVNELLSLSTIKPAILFHDDIHWADSAALSLLQYLAIAIAITKIAHVFGRKHRSN
jgi:hypothetical protein